MGNGPGDSRLNTRMPTGPPRDSTEASTTSPTGLFPLNPFPHPTWRRESFGLCALPVGVMSLNQRVPMYSLSFCWYRSNSGSHAAGSSLIDIYLSLQAISTSHNGEDSRITREPQRPFPLKLSHSIFGYEIGLLRMRQHKESIGDYGIHNGFSRLPSCDRTPVRRGRLGRRLIVLPNR